MRAESIDDFTSGCRRIFGLSMPFHSLYVSFSDLDYFCPALIRDSLPIKYNDPSVSDRYMRLNPTQPFLRQNMGITQSVFEDHIGIMADADRRAYLRRFKQREGWDKYAEIYFWDQNSLQAHICVRRSPDQPDFAGDDLRLMADLRQALSSSVSRLHRNNRERMASYCLFQVLKDSPMPLILLDWNLNPICFSTAARRACADWVHGEGLARSMKIGLFNTVPAEILAGCQLEKSRLCAPADSPARFAAKFRNVLHPARSDFSAQIESLGISGEPVAMPHFLVRFQRVGCPTPKEGTTQPPASLSVLSCLTRCEREIALLVGQGLTNREIAAQLSKSVPTVKMQLQSIFRKLVVSNRTQVATLLR